MSAREVAVLDVDCRLSVDAAPGLCRGTHDRQHDVLVVVGKDKRVFTFRVPGATPVTVPQ